MPYGDANAIVVDMAREVLPIVKDTPVLAGVCGTDPFRIMKVFLPQLRDMGFDGVQNFPTVGLIDGQFRQILEETGMSIRLEIEMIATAHELGMLTCPYVFDPETARLFTEAGADIVVAHVNTTVAGSIGVRTAAVSLDQAVDRVQAMHDAAKAVNPDVLVLCHGGPIAEPKDAQWVLERTRGVAGFFGASSIERLATEPAIEEQARKFKAIRPGK
jgi:predicted TIM-barrel enzyme